MTKKIYFLLAFLLTMIGGGRLWATEYVLSNTDALCIKNENSLKSVNYSQVSRQFGSNGPVIIYSSTLTSGFTVNNEVIKFNGSQTPIKDPAGKITITNANSNISSVQITFSSTGKDIPYTCNGVPGTIASGSTSQAFTVNNSSCELQFTIPASEGNTNYYLVIYSITIHTAGDDGVVTPIAVDASFANSTITCEPSSGTITNELTISSPSPLFEPTISYAISGDAVGTVNSSGEVTMGESTGSATVTATITPPNTKYYAVTNKTYTLTSAINSFAGTYPYTWDFTTGWGVTAEQLSNSSYWGDYDSTNGIVVNQTNIADEFLWTGNSGNHPNLGKTYGIKFTSTREGGVAKRIRLCPGSYVQIQNGVSFKLSSLSKGQKITIETSESNGFNSVANATLVDGNYVVSANGDVIFDVSDRSNSGVMKITRITISKPTLEIFRLEGTNELTRTYDANNLKIGRSSSNNDNAFMIYLDPNAATALETKRISSDLLHVTVDDESVVTVTDVAFTDYNNDTQHRQRGTFFLRAVKPGTTNINLVFDGNDTYEPMTVSAAFTLNKADQSISYPNSSVSISYGESVNKTVNNTLTVTSNPTGNTVTYTSSDTNVAPVDAYGTVTVKNSGTCEITASLSGNDFYNAASASYTLTVNGTQTPTIAWSSSNGFTESGGDYIAADLPYGNHKSYTAYVLDADGSGVKDDAIRYGLVEEYEGYLTIDSNTGKIEPTRKFADESLTEKVVQVYAYIPGNGTRNPAPRIIYNVKIVKGTFSGNLFKQTELTVNAGCTIAPQNNVQSMRWEDIDAITVDITSGSSETAVSGPGTEMVSDYKADTSNKTLYFDTKTKNDVEIVDWFYPVFHGKAVGDVTFTVTLKSKLYGDQSGDFTLHVKASDEHTGFAWASATRKYTIYEGDYMLLPEISGSTNGNFSYSVGADNQSTHHKYVYTRRWNGSQYVTTYNNRNFHKGEGFPNFDLTSDAEGNTAVTEVQADGSNVALLFWNTGSGTENDRLLIYGNKEGTVYLKAFDPQITSRSLSTIEIEVKSRSAIDTDFSSVVSGMTFPYTWDFTTNYDWSTEIETGTGNWIQDGSTYNLGMSSNINYDYADEDKDGLVWGNDNNDPTTNSNELTSKLFVGQNNKVLRGFAGMKIKLGNNGTGSWYSKRDGIHILPYSTPGVPRLRVSNGTHTLILPTPTGDACPETFKVFVKVKTLADNDATLWVRYADLSNGDSGQTKYYKFKYDDKDPENSRNVPAGTDVIYSITATKGQLLELDLDKVDVYWVAYSTEAKIIPRPTTNDFLTYAAASYSYNADLDISKSLDANDGVTAYYASGFTKADKGISAGSDSSGDDEGDYAVKMSPLNGAVPANTGILLKKEIADNCYMIVNAKNMESEQYSPPGALSTNYLKGTGNGVSVSRTITNEDGTYSNFAISHAYKYYKDITNPSTVQGGYRFDRDWSFYPIMGDATNIAAQKAYLQIPGNLYVNKNGEIVDLPASSRASWRAADDDDAPVAPASKAALSIVFEDELPLSPENPDVTGVFDIERHADDNIINNGVWYNMEGMRISTPTKPGLYIRNGKKVFIK